MDLQTIINDQASSGEIKIPAGIYTPTTNIYIPSNVTVQGVGYKTKIVMPAQRSLIVENGYNVTIKNLLIDADQQQVNDKALIISNPHDVQVERCWVLNCGGFGMFPVSSESFAGKLRLVDNRLSGKGNNDVLGGGPMNANSNLIDLIIERNFIRQQVSEGHTYRAGLDIVSMQRTILKDNIIEGSLIAGGEKIPHVNVLMEGNIVSPARGSAETQIAVLTASNAGESDLSYDLSIKNNHVISGSIYVQGQSQTSTRTQASVVGNSIRALKTSTNDDYNRGISLNYVVDCEVYGNTIRGAGTGLFFNNAQNTLLGVNRFIGCDTERTDVNGTTYVS